MTVMTTANRRAFLKAMGIWSIRAAAGAPALAVLLSGCKTMDEVGKVGAQIGAASGLVTYQQASALQKSATAVARSFEDFTPENEYHIGRAVAAVILNKYPPFDHPKANEYVNLVGQSAAAASKMPRTYGGYHFLIQNSEEINALSAPGGLVFVTRGLLRCCNSEEALAGVLAHEVGHVQARHGIQAIRQSRINEAFLTIGMEGAKTFGSPQVAELTRTFEGAIDDIVQKLINSGYARSSEYEADAAAVPILKGLGYDPNGLVDMLTIMEQRLIAGRADFAKTHPSPESRINQLRGIIGPHRPVRSTSARMRRFEKAMATV